MFDAIARVLAFFYSLPVVGGSYGLAIIMLTVAVMILLMPLTLRATKSTIKMQEMQPKLKALQKKYKDDKPTLNAELMELYKEHGINPVGGCLPMLAQLPVFLVLFNVLRGLSRRVSGTSFFTIADHARVEAGGASIPGETFDPQYLSHGSDMYEDLSRSTEMRFGPFDLAQEALDVIQANFLRGIPYVLLILFVVASSFIQQRQVSARRSGNVAINPQQEMILKFLPLLSGIWSFIFPAGLVLYWATSNLFRIGQQGYITRAYYGERDEADKAAKAVAAADDLLDDAADKPKNKADNKPNNKAGNKVNGAKPKSKGAQGGKKQGEKKQVSARSSNGATSDNGAGQKRNREEAWAKRRQEKAKVKASKREPTQSSRVTPKGTKPSGPKKKRKR